MKAEVTKDDVAELAATIRMLRYALKMAPPKRALLDHRYDRYVDTILEPALNGTLKVPEGS